MRCNSRGWERKRGIWYDAVMCVTRRRVIRCRAGKVYSVRRGGVKKGSVAMGREGVLVGMWRCLGGCRRGGGM